MAKKKANRSEDPCDKPFYVEWYAGSGSGWNTLKEFKKESEAEEYRKNLDDWHRSSAKVRKKNKCK
jgi:hypothetical protein